MIGAILALAQVSVFLSCLISPATVLQMMYWPDYPSSDWMLARRARDFSEWISASFHIRGAQGRRRAGELTHIAIATAIRTLRCTTGIPS